MTATEHTGPEDLTEDDATDAAPWPDCRWYSKDPRSCLEPDSCGCYVDPCDYFGLSPEDCCIEGDVLCGD